MDRSEGEPRSGLPRFVGAVVQLGPWAISTLTLLGLLLSSAQQSGARADQVTQLGARMDRSFLALRGAIAELRHGMQRQLDQAAAALRRQNDAEVAAVEQQVAQLQSAVTALNGVLMRAPDAPARALGVP